LELTVQKVKPANDCPSIRKKAKKITPIGGLFFSGKSQKDSPIERLFLYGKSQKDSPIGRLFSCGGKIPKWGTLTQNFEIAFS